VLRSESADADQIGRAIPLSFPKPYADGVARLRVPGGFILLIAFAWLAHPSPASIAAGLPVAGVGLAIRAWAAGHLEKNQTLATGGPYAWVRNPLYIGTLIAAAGFVIAARSWILAALFAAVFLLVYLPVVELEEQHLRTLFPQYAAYAQRVPSFLPRGRFGGSGGRFALRRYLRNEEYLAALGALLGTAWLLLRLFWF